MLEMLTQMTWSPYIAGAGIGVMSWLAFFLSDKPLGCSTSFFRTFGIIRKAVHKKGMDENPYYIKYKPEIDWQWMLVLGIVIGAFLSSVLSGVFEITWVPDMFASEFGDSPVLRLIVALTGGVIMGFGARFAGGCTSGHGISGTTQLSLTSIVAVIFMFCGGIAMAMAIYGVF
ncbi:putative membrane protein YedE/YeeE [Methanomicrobium sp. W14]|uniref:YeeE/YedE thiosulfate transporter family protein n=1 Tax=Methanomicrobium sp. W14 TaxID=2817839 RepID=UPI001AE2D765|nr:YeeE/YedE thiosulfate transporter family protein [Methanomicrobium sp. W14]MBP2132528.1 putative membrane protein YedE/YeeE [Methanomicrobium sp. W14]